MTKQEAIKEANLKMMGTCEYFLKQRGFYYSIESKTFSELRRDKENVRIEVRLATEDDIISITTDREGILKEKRIEFNYFAMVGYLLTIDPDILSNIVAEQI